METILGIDRVLHHLLFSLVFAFNSSIPRVIIFNMYIYIVEYHFESITFDVKYNTICIVETKYLSI